MGSGPAMALSDWFPARFGGRQGIVGPASENRGFLTRPLACHFDASVDVIDARIEFGVAPRNRSFVGLSHVRPPCQETTMSNGMEGIPTVDGRGRISYSPRTGVPYCARSGTSD